MAQTTITLSFDVAALVPDELPGPDALRHALEDSLPGVWWSSTCPDWWLQHINTTPQQPEAVNAVLLKTLQRVERRFLSVRAGVCELPAEVIAAVKDAIAAATRA